VGCLYRHFDKDGRLLYVGASANPFQRMQYHSNLAVWFREIARVELEHFPCRDDALEAEAKAIKLERPKYNSGLIKNPVNGQWMRAGP
jgi:excinuclease UvrABC nuclease subunit